MSDLRPSSDGRHFTDDRGKPVFWLGDTQWELFNRLETEAARKILKDRQDKGFNVILVMLLGIDRTQFGLKTEAPHANLVGEVPWQDGDPLKPNEDYFKRIDGMIRLGEKTGQTFVVGVYHQWNEKTIPAGKARRWGKWVASRYREVPNLIWSMYPKAEESFAPVCRELAAGLKEGDGGSHLISVHPDPSVASSSFLHREEWLAFNMIQVCVNYDRINEAVGADYARKPVKPVVMAEGGYEGLEFGKLQEALQIRQQAYWTQLAGGHHVYGHNDAWQFPERWAEWLDSPGSRDLGAFRDVFESLDRWWEMVPDQSLFAAGGGSGFALNAAARWPDSRRLLVYFSSPSTVTLSRGALKGTKSARAEWINPAGGERRDAGKIAPDSLGPFTSPDGWADALLLITAE